jgi:hypothetical protein
MSPVSASVGDFNGDGKHDIVATNGNSGNISFLISNCNSTVTSLSSPDFEEDLESGFRSFPNPSNSISTVDFSVNESTNAKLSVLDLKGCTVAILLDEKLNKGKYEKQFDTQVLVPGIYMYKLEVNNTVKTIRLVVE